MGHGEVSSCELQASSCKRAVRLFLQHEAHSSRLLKEQ
ncbi:hypothetical protein C4J89_5003 [Pseudomonas sp. R4-35-07]|nr:hypothetical protein C4J91_5115 [Pseudomonas sp. R3-52-08]AZF34430.1 hypothetical protein C4J89_5003 [Pseudomonas sp. R4-35-07]